MPMILPAAVKQSSRINVGAVYRVADWADLDLSYERGNTLMFASPCGRTLRTCARRCVITRNRLATGTGQAALTIPCGERAHRAKYDAASMRRRSFSAAIPYT
ncbi:YjbH domain-containing protein [Enterobacter hormaechei]